MHLIKIENQPHLKGIKGEDLTKFFEKRKPSYIYIHFTLHLPRMSEFFLIIMLFDTHGIESQRALKLLKTLGDDS